jgi:hypothetical protein
MPDHRFVYPNVHEIRATVSPDDPARRLVRPLQRDLVMASLLRRPADEPR